MRTPKRRPHETTELLQVKSANKILASDRLGAKSWIQKRIGVTSRYRARPGDPVRPASARGSSVCQLLRQFLTVKRRDLMADSNAVPR